MATFSDRQRSPFLVPHLYGDANDAMHHLKVEFALLSFSFHTCLKRSDSLQYCLDLRDLVLLLYRVLNRAIAELKVKALWTESAMPQPKIITSYCDDLRSEHCFQDAKLQ